MSSNTNDNSVAPGMATPDRVTLVLQGGGALGAYQAGVYQALDEAGMRPDWAFGTSIGAINASLIAGNSPDERLNRLKAFWRRVEHGLVPGMMASVPMVGGQLANFMR